MPLWAVTYEAVVPGATEEEAIENAADDEEGGIWQVRMIAQQTLAEAFGVPEPLIFDLAVELTP